MEFVVTPGALAWVKKALEKAGQLRASELFDDESERWFGATIDSRGDCSHRLFFALTGGKTDGHRFVDDALSKGSCAAVIEHAETAQGLGSSRRPYFLVHDTLKALQELSRAYRDTLDLRVVAVTGSAGKTTTKEYIKVILKRKYRLHSNPGNFNNHIGVPLTLLETDQDNEYLVAEVAANHTGEIEFLSRLLRPDVGVITNIGDAHIGLFGSRDKIAEAKAELFEGIDREGTAVLPGEDDYIDFLRERAHCRVVTFGRAEGNDFRVSAVREENDFICFELNGMPLRIQSVGVYNVFNAAAAFAVGEFCGVESEGAREALEDAEPMAGRARIHRGSGITIIDDSYNANPTSMRASLESLMRMSGKRRVAVLGDMAELGAFAPSAHRELGEFIAGTGVDMVYWIGDHGEDVRAGVKGGGRKNVLRPFTRMDELLRSISKMLAAGDVVLVKASRAQQLDKVVDELTKNVLKENEG